MLKKRITAVFSAIMLCLSSFGTVYPVGVREDVTLSADYVVPAESKEYYYRSYFDGICDSLDTATTANKSFQGNACLEVTPNPSSENGYINLDSYNWTSLGIDLSKYGTCVIIYKYVTEDPAYRGKAQLRILPQKIFSKQKYLNSRESVVANRWATVSFDLASARDIIKSDVAPIIKQLHFLPFGTMNVKNLSADDRLYISKIYFFADESTGSAYRKSYISGTSDVEGNSIFNIGGLLTRAHAANMIARILADGDSYVPASDGESAYDDISEHGSAKYIEYLEDLGFLQSFTEDEFRPDDYISHSKFAELCHLLEVYFESGKKTFYQQHAEATPAKVQSGEGGAISRSEAVVMLNAVSGRKPYADGVFEKFKGKYADVPEYHPAYGDILDASLDHISLVDKNGNEYWIWGFGNASATENFSPDYTTGNIKLAEAKELFAKRVDEIQNSPDTQFDITGNTYYVSTYGDDSNDGLSQTSALKTASRASQLAQAGDLVLFERGCEWRERWNAKSGVTYSAYGYGAKPVFNGNLFGNAADPDLWTLVEGSTNVYEYKYKTLDVGNIVLNGNSTVTKLTPNIQNGIVMLNGKEFDPATSITSTNRFISVYENPSGNGVTLDGTAGLATLYFRCAYGNPGEYYDSIELCTRGHIIVMANNTTFDNIEIKYTGSHGFSGGGMSNLRFTNCVISYIGGSAQYYTVNSSGQGYMVRFGNGIEIYGSCDGFTIDNCYVYQCYDAGITHQFSQGGTQKIYHKNVNFTNNVIDKCIYNIEYFMGSGETGNEERFMENILYSGNILSRSGRGWGHSPTRAGSIVGWNHHYNKAENFVIRDNLFFGDYYNSIIIGAENEEWLPDFSGNTYIVRYNGNFAKYGTVADTVQYNCKGTLYDVLEKVFYDDDCEVYWINSYVN